MIHPQLWPTPTFIVLYLQYFLIFLLFRSQSKFPFCSSPSTYIRIIGISRNPYCRTTGFFFFAYYSAVVHVKFHFPQRISSIDRSRRRTSIGISCFVWPSVVMQWSSQVPILLLFYVLYYFRFVIQSTDRSNPFDRRRRASSRSATRVSHGSSWLHSVIGLTGDDRYRFFQYT